MKRTTLLLAAAVVLLAAAATGGVVMMSSAQQAATALQEPPPNTAKVERGKLSAMISLAGTLTYRARPDGSPYSVVNQTRGTYTELPENGDRIDCGDVLYRVNDKAVLLLCGTVPAYRDLHSGDVGEDVRQLNQNLHRLGHDAGGEIHPGEKVFTWKTQKALEGLQRGKGLDGTGQLALGDVVFLPESVRIARVSGELGGAAQPGVPVAQATTDTLVVHVDLEASQQGEVQAGDRAQITLPGHTSVTGKVERLGRVATVPDGQNGGPAAATLPASITLDHPNKARGLDQAPVQVDITTRGVEGALSVPVVALVGKSGGGFAVEVVRSGGARELVAVGLGLFDTAAGRVQVEGELREGDEVVVPSS